MYTVHCAKEVNQTIRKNASLLQHTMDSTLPGGIMVRPRWAVPVFEWWNVTKEALENVLQAMLICDNFRKVLVLMPGAALTLRACHDFLSTWVW